MSSGLNRRFRQVEAFVHANLFLLLVCTYILAAICPRLGETARSLDFPTPFGDVAVPGLLLSLLLFNAGVGVSIPDALAIVRRPKLLGIAVAATSVAPLAFTGVVAIGLHGWHNEREAAAILFGVAMIASMPVAGSSAAWTQRAGGDLALGLGIVVVSTFLSPWLTPLSLEIVGAYAGANFKVDLNRLSSQSPGKFLLICVAIPTALGIAVRMGLGDARVAAWKHFRSVASSITLIGLCYIGASASLPKVLAEPDWDFLAVLGAVVAMMSAFAFGTGWVISRLVKAEPKQRSALLYGLGMTNNGTGLALAGSGTVGADAILPLVIYNLAQHLTAACVERWSIRHRSS